MFAIPVYIRIQPDRISVRNVKTGKEISRQSEQPFTTTRLLVGNFSAADALLKQLLGEVVGKHFFSPPCRAVIHPLTMVDGGLSEVEKRLFHELALGAGAGKVLVHCGDELNDAAVSAAFLK